MLPAISIAFHVEILPRGFFWICIREQTSINFGFEPFNELRSSVDLPELPGWSAHPGFHEPGFKEVHTHIEMGNVYQTMFVLIVGVKDIDQAGIDPQGNTPVLVVFEFIRGPVFRQEARELLVFGCEESIVRRVVMSGCVQTELW